MRWPCTSGWESLCRLRTGRGEHANTPRFGSHSLVLAFALLFVVTNLPAQSSLASKGLASDRPSEHFPIDMVRSEPSLVTISAGIGLTSIRQLNMILAGRRYAELRPDAITFFFYRSLIESEPDDPLTCGMEFCVNAGLPKPNKFNAFSLSLQLRSLGFRTENFGIYSIANIGAEQLNVTLTRNPPQPGDNGPTVYESSWLNLRCDLGLAMALGFTTREERTRIDPFTERLERHGFQIEARVGYAFSPYYTDSQQAEALGFQRPEALTPAFFATIRIGSRFTVQQ